jgi:hypothetical protein
VLDGVELSGAIALQLTGSGSVTAKNCKITGKISSVGTGKFIDGGGNTIK